MSSRYDGPRCFRASSSTRNCASSFDPANRYSMRSAVPRKFRDRDGASRIPSRRIRRFLRTFVRARNGLPSRGHSKNTAGRFGSASSARSNSAGSSGMESSIISGLVPMLRRPPSVWLCACSGEDRRCANCTRWRERKTMLINTKQLKGLTIRASDGEFGKVDQVYFDDETWGIRYLTVETGAREVLISPISIVRTDWQVRRLDVALTKKQMENSPDIDTHKPVSRQHEAEYYGYYGYPFYWGGPYLWGPVFYPSGLAVSTGASIAATPESILRESPDSHLRSAEAVTG